MSKGYASNYRVALLASFVLLGFAGIGARLVWLHVIARDELLGHVEKARRELIPDHAHRGDVLDANGSLLATSRSVMVLGVDPQSERLEDRKKWPELALLTGLPLPQLESILTTRYRAAAAPGSRPVSGLKIGFNRGGGPAPTVAAAVDPDSETILDEEDSQGRRPIRWAKLSEDLPVSIYDQIVKLGVRGVYGQRVYRRAYPHNELAAHIIGFVNRVENPISGIEKYANFYLRGQDGWLESEKDGHQQELAQFRTRQVPAADGYNVVLSLDAAIQHMAESELDAIVQKYHPLKATIIISDPRTGFVLALANAPSFDLNRYNQLGKMEEGRLTDIALADVYEPGSVFKIVAASGALNDGLVTPATTFDCTLEKIDYEGRSRALPREDSSEHHDHPLSVAEIIAHSSNKGAAQLAMRLGDRRFYDYVRAFGFGQKTGFPDLGGESWGLLTPPEKWDGLTITRMPMGQSVAATPLQMHEAMSVIASGGLRLRPQIIKQIRDAGNEVIYRFDRMEIRRVISEKTARTMARLLQAVASDQGTAPEAAIPGFEVAGKTGTANKVLPHTHVYADHHHVASFIGFFPATNPQVLISVIVDDADAYTPGGVAYGAKVAAPSFRRIGMELIPYLHIRSPIEQFARPNLALEGGRR